MSKVILSFILLMAHFGSMSAHASNGPDHYVFLGNHDIPPFIFIQNGDPAGLVVDLAHTLARKSQLNIEVQAMDWQEAQSKVLHGEADALLQINRNKEREIIYDFSEPLLESRFSIFRKNTRIEITNIKSLSGLTVGVEVKGYPIQLLEKFPEINVLKIPNWKKGFELVNAGQIEAVIVDRWVGEYVLAINDIRGITVVDKPVEKSYSRIAVRKGNQLLLDKINEGLKKMREDGSMKQILNRWSKKEVVYLSKERLDYYKLSILFMVLSLAFLLIIMVMILFWNKRLNKEISIREQVEKTLNQFKFTLDQTLDCIFMFKPDSLKIFYTNHGAMQQLGYTKEEFSNLTPLDIKPEFTEKTFRDMIMPLTDGSRKSLLFETIHKHKDGTIIPAEVFLQFIPQPGETDGLFLAIVRDITDRRKIYQQLQTVMDTVDAMIYVADLDTDEIILANNYVRKHFGDVVGKKCWEAIQANQTGPCDFCEYHRLRANNQLLTGVNVWQIHNRRNGEWYECHDEIIQWVDDRNVRIQVATNISDLKTNEQEREKLIKELQGSIDEVKTLRGILPICSFCKNIRNDEGYYEQIEEYIHKHSCVDFSHTICPTCMKKHYPEEYDSIMNEK